MSDRQSSQFLLLWDCSDEPPATSGLTYRWNGYVEGGTVFSLLRYVESRGERFRGKYLEWIHQLGEAVIDGRRLTEHLLLDAGFSYWWMTLLVEKSPWKSPAIIDAIRLFALEDILLENRPAGLRFVSANEVLGRIVGELCRNLNIGYEWQRLKVARRSGLRDLVRSLPQPVRAGVSLLRYMLDQHSLRRVRNRSGFSGEKTAFFCSYFIHLDPKSCPAGEFQSQQWGSLPGLLRQSEYRTNWIHHFLQSSFVPDTKVAIDWVRGFNAHAERQGLHQFVGSHLSWPVVLRVLRGWFKLFAVSSRLGAVKDFFQPSGHHFSLWPLLKNDWHASMYGSTAMVNLLWIELFDAALAKLPPQKTGLFLTENQSWERALVRAWRKYGHGRLIAVQHSTVRFWDLRYFNDARAVRSLAPAAMPQADLVAVNGRAVADAYKSVDFPMERVVECEALRFEYLSNIADRQTASSGKNGPLKILIMGDYLPASTVKMLKLLELASPHISRAVQYTLKPHPSFMVDPNDFPNLNLEVVVEPLSELLPNFDMAYSSNVTSAAVDAYFAGIPVVIAMDDTELNFSPLRGKAGARFVATPQELADALQTTSDGAERRTSHTDFFFLDPQLPRWKRLLGLEETASS